jgi:hypothetical protein
VAIWAGVYVPMLPAWVLPALILIGCIYLILALRYWFRIPAIGVAIGTGCLIAGWVLSLRCSAVG